LDNLPHITCLKIFLVILEKWWLWERTLFDTKHTFATKWDCWVFGLALDFTQRSFVWKKIFIQLFEWGFDRWCIQVETWKVRLSNSVWGIFAYRSFLSHDLLIRGTIILDPKNFWIYINFNAWLGLLTKRELILSWVLFKFFTLSTLRCR
jgi:hypothetical protein